MINSPAPYTSNNFCGLNKNVGDPYYMIDGNNESVWANVNLNEAYFSFDFKDSNFLLKSYTLQWPCNKLTAWSVFGSNDKETWYLIDKIENDNKNVEFSHKKCSNPGTYRFIKFTTTSQRFHLTNVDLFGIYNPGKFLCSFVKNSSKRITFLFHVIALLYS